MSIPDTFSGPVAAGRALMALRPAMAVAGAYARLVPVCGHGGMPC